MKTQNLLSGYRQVYIVDGCRTPFLKAKVGDLSILDNLDLNFIMSDVFK